MWKSGRPVLPPPEKGDSRSLGPSSRREVNGGTGGYTGSETPVAVVGEHEVLVVWVLPRTDGLSSLSRKEDHLGPPSPLRARPRIVVPTKIRKQISKLPTKI